MNLFFGPGRSPHRLGDLGSWPVPELAELVVSGVPPFGLEVLALEPGLNALYGLNGAGKTTLLDAIRAAASGMRSRSTSGQPSRVELRFRLRPDPSAKRKRGESLARQDTPLVQQVLAPLSQVMNRGLLVPPVAPTLSSVLAFKIQEAFRFVKSDDKLRTIVQELGPRLRISLVPVGSSDATWRVSLTTSYVQDDTPKTTRLFSKWSREWEKICQLNLDAHKSEEAMVQSEEGDPDLGDRLNEAVDEWGHLLVPFDRLSNATLGLEPSGFLEQVNHRFPRSGEPLVLFESTEFLAPRLLSFVETEGDAESLPLPPLVGEGVKEVAREGGLAPTIREQLAAASTAATAILGRLLLDAPVLEIEEIPTRDWLRQPALRWTARDPSTGAPVPISSLSRAQKKWAGFAIKWSALAPAEARPRIAVIDEPESAMHRTAERHLAAGLSEIAQESNVYMVVATHSPFFLDEPSTRVIRVYRDSVDGTARTGPLDGVRMAELAELGLRPSDLLARTKTFLLVEGQHDKIVIESFIGARLEELRVGVLAMRGATQAPSIASCTILMKYLDADFVAVLDNTNASRVQDAWIVAKNLKQVKGRKAAQEHLNERLSDKDTECVYLKKLMIEALHEGTENRFQRMWGVRAPDILDYLPCERIVPGQNSWEKLRAEYEALSKKRRPQFKKWIEREYEARLEDWDVKAAAESMDRIPPEFSALLMALEEPGDSGMIVEPQ